MFKRFEEELIKHKKPYVVLKGDLIDRFNIAIEEIDELLKNR